AGLKLPESKLSANGSGAAAREVEINMVPIRLARYSVNQRLPSGPTVIPWMPGMLAFVGCHSAIVPLGVIRPIFPGLLNSTNHRLPSGPATMPSGALLRVGTVYSVITPDVLIAPIRLPDASVSHRRPSGPVAIESGKLPADGSANSVTTPLTVMRPILSVMASVNHSCPSGPMVRPSGALLGVGSANSVTVPSVAMRPIPLLP